jgi:hypothetical protein
LIGTIAAASTEDVEYSALTDQQVVEHALNGRESAYRELIDRYSTREVLELRFRADGEASLDGRLEGVC